VIQLTKRTEYGLIALVHLADAALTGRDGAFVSVREIAEHYPVPKRLLAEVLKDLARAELVESARGKDGGYTLRRQPDQITLAEVVASKAARAFRPARQRNAHRRARTAVWSPSAPSARPCTAYAKASGV
jgi:Rrf2 family protein